MEGLDVFGHFDAPEARRDGNGHGQSPANDGPRRYGHSPLQSGSCYNSSFYPPAAGFAPAPFSPYNGGVRSSTEHMLSSLVEAQSKVFKMVEDVSKRLGSLENVVSNLTDKANESIGPSSSSSPDQEKKRLPPQLSVCFFLI